jgi:nitrogen fixation/metabolism regulation signal transduction histidine kinase
MHSDPETEALRQWFDALIKDIDAAEAKVAATHRRVQAACLLLEEEQATAADLERKAAAAKDLLTQCFEHLGAIIRRSSPFPNFLKIHDDLLLEEIHLDTAGPSAAPTPLYTSTAPSASKPQHVEQQTSEPQDDVGRAVVVRGRQRGRECPDLTWVVLAPVVHHRAVVE